MEHGKHPAIFDDFDKMSLIYRNVLEAWNPLPGEYL
jgi:hypothetical protein